VHRGGLGHILSQVLVNNGIEVVGLVRNAEKIDWYRKEVSDAIEMHTYSTATALAPNEFDGIVDLTGELLSERFIQCLKPRSFYCLAGVAPSHQTELNVGMINALRSSFLYGLFCQIF